MRSDYERFLEDFTCGLLENHQDVCFYTYGSFCEPKRFVPGVGDLDGGLILPGGTVTQKRKVLDIARLLDASLGELDIDFDFNLLDKTTNSDGRFLSYPTSMTDFIRDWGQVVSGPGHYVDEMNGLDYRSEDLKQGAMCFRNLRNRLFTSYYDARIDYRRFKRNAKSSLKQAVKFPKQLVLVRTGVLITNSFDARKAIFEGKPGGDGLLEQSLSAESIQVFLELEGVLKNEGVLDKKIRDRDEAIYWMSKGLEAVELLIDAYLKEFPKIDYDKECRMF
jgi:hypothetical protein